MEKQFINIIEKGNLLEIQEFYKNKLPEWIFEKSVQQNRLWITAAIRVF